jgi:hypothetical protein
LRLLWPICPNQLVDSHVLPPRCGLRTRQLVVIDLLAAVITLLTVYTTLGTALGLSNGTTVVVWLTGRSCDNAGRPTAERPVLTTTPRCTPAGALMSSLCPEPRRLGSRPSCAQRREGGQR